MFLLAFVKNLNKIFFPRARTKLCSKLKKYNNQLHIILYDGTVHIILIISQFLIITHFHDEKKINYEILNRFFRIVYRTWKKRASAHSMGPRKTREHRSTAVDALSFGRQQTPPPTHKQTKTTTTVRYNKKCIENSMRRVGGAVMMRCFWLAVVECWLFCAVCLRLSCAARSLSFVYVAGVRCAAARSHT